MKIDYPVRELEVGNEEELHVFKFVALLHVALEYFTYSEEILTENMVNLISTRHKERFISAARKDKRLLVKAYDADMKRFKSQFKEFRKKNVAMLAHLEGVKTQDKDLFDGLTDDIVEFIDQIITKQK